MKRRAFLAAAASVPVATTLSGCLHSSTPSAGGGGTAGGKKSVTVLLGDDTNIQDLWTKYIVPGFTKANPDYAVSVTFDLHGDHDQQNLAKLTAAVKQNKSAGFDLTDEKVTQAAIAKLLVPQSASTLPAMSGFSQTLIQQGFGAGVPYRASSVLLAYDTKTVTNPPKTFTDLIAWIKAHPGKFTYCSPKSGGSGGNFVTTALDAHMPTSIGDKMRLSYDESLETHWDAGFAVLRGLNPYVYQKGVYPNGNDQVLDLLSNGQISLAPVWSDQFITAQQNGQIPSTVKVHQISGPALCGGANYIGVAKTAANTDVAQKLLEYLLGTEAQSLIAEKIAGYPVIPINKLPASVQSKFASASPSELRPTYFGDFGTDLNNKWDQKVPK